MIAPSDDVVVVDPEALEFGVTEMVPTIRKPRWTPGFVTRQPITPRHLNDQVAGELEIPKRR